MERLLLKVFHFLYDSGANIQHHYAIFLRSNINFKKFFTKNQPNHFNTLVTNKVSFYIFAKNCTKKIL